jgi:hypothetical protein
LTYGGYIALAVCKSPEYFFQMYHNWFSPFLWSQIELGAKHPSVRKSLSTYQLVKVMQQKDPITFGGLSRSTIEGWIDRSGAVPRWNDATLARIERGNHQGYDHEGRKGVLVCEKLFGSSMH